MARLGDVMASDPVTVAPGTTVAAAASTMVAGRVGSLLVVEEDAVVGILTERDVLRAAGAGGDLLSTRVRDWMTREPTTAPAEQDSEDAVVTMLDNGFRHLPVTDGSGVVGIVSLRDLLAARVTGGSQHAGHGHPATSDPAPEASPTAVHERRDRMFEATRELQRCSHAATADEEAWRRDLAAAVTQVDDVVAHHVADTEDEGGYFEELVRESGGRLAAAVRRLRRDHERSTVLVSELRAAVDGRAEPESLRQAADELFAQLEAHRHRGSDLLWQAYGVEIGGEH